MKKLPFFICANWKMNKNPEEAANYLQVIKKLVSTEQQKHFVFFAPAFILAAISKELSDSGFRWGAQNCHFEDKGAFTGENSPMVLQQMGATDCLVGHSERRRYFNEDSSVVQKKLKALLRNSLIPTLCVGETLEQRKQGKYFETVKEQLEMILELEYQSEESIQIAYEPVWAIGSGQSASVKQIQEMHQFIYSTCQQAGKNVLVLYGGSVNKENASELSNLPEVHGFLVGGASLDPKELFGIFKSVQNL